MTYMRTCDACGRKVDANKLKSVREQFRSETIARGTPGLVKNYYKSVWLCPRCRFLRKLSIVIAIIVDIPYFILWAHIIGNSSSIILFIIFGVILNPLTVMPLFMGLFRIATKCDTLFKTDFHSK